MVTTMELNHQDVALKLARHQVVQEEVKVREIHGYITGSL